MNLHPASCTPRLGRLGASLRRRVGLALAVVTSCGLVARAQESFVNWESPHVHPLELVPGGRLLAAVGTADACLELFALPGEGETDAAPARAFSVPVGLDPISVRAESAERAWVVNRVSDSISVVDLARRTVIATLDTDDEPADVVFAGSPRRAFVSCSQTNSVLVFDPARLDAPPARIAIDGEEPRALAASSDGKHVYAAMFASGNDTTILGGGSLFNLDFPPNVVNSRVGPYSGANPPPNVREDASFAPARNPANPTPPRVGLIVRRDARGAWRDDAGGDWTHLVSGPHAARSGRPEGWELVDHDVAILDTASLNVTYARHLMNTCAALSVHPASGDVVLVGTDATNERRFEPVLRGRFLNVLSARVKPSGDTIGVVNLNPHLSGAAPTLAPELRARSIGDPRAIAWDTRGAVGWVAGLGSNNVVALDASGARAKDVVPLEVGAGPTGLAYDAARQRLYVLCRFDASIAVVDVPQWNVSARAHFHDATPAAIRVGRRHLFDTHASSGQGQIACASCHVDARMDHLAWDLGDPAGLMKPLEDVNLAARNPVLLSSEVPGRGPFEPFHPMKGPMTTQSLQDVVGHEPLHWRGDRAGIAEFAGAFATLQARAEPLSPREVQELEGYLATITYPPNPHRDFDNALPESLPLPGHFTTGRFGPAGVPLPAGNARRGLERFRTAKLDNGKVDCVTCHTLPTGYGTDMELVDGEYRALAPGPRGERHHMLVSQDGSTNVTMKVPQLRNLYDKVGFDLTQRRNHFGFGFLHDGSVDSLARFVNETQFSLASDAETADMVAFLLAFSGSDLPAGSARNPSEPPGAPSRDTHAAVGRQSTIAGRPNDAQRATWRRARALADSRRVGLVVKGRVGGEPRGYAYVGADTFQSDRARESATFDELLDGGAEFAERTLTVVPLATARRLGIDRDLDGVLDRDERDAGSDPADSSNRPR